MNITTILTTILASVAATLGITLTIWEDSPLWDCGTMGNQQCGTSGYEEAQVVISV